MTNSSSAHSPLPDAARLPGRQHPARPPAGKHPGRFRAKIRPVDRLREADSPAAQGGLTLGDTIVAFGDAAISHHDDLLTQLSGDRVGTAVPIKILRGGKLEMVGVTVGEKA